MSHALGAIKGVFRVAVFPADACVSILALADCPITVARAVQYLELAGYVVKEADRDAYQRIEAALGSETLDIPAIAGSCAAPDASAAAQPSASLTSLADSLAPLREHFNAAKGRYRFVALLSPT